jgi:hypothetical protein
MGISASQARTRDLSLAFVDQKEWQRRARMNLMGKLPSALAPSSQPLNPVYLLKGNSSNSGHSLLTTSCGRRFFD